MITIVADQFAETLATACVERIYRVVGNRGADNGRQGRAVAGLLTALRPGKVDTAEKRVWFILHAGQGQSQPSARRWSGSATR